MKVPLLDLKPQYRALKGEIDAAIAGLVDRKLDALVVDADQAFAIAGSRIVDLAARGASAVVISQDLDELFEIADRIAVIHGGAIAYEAPRSELDIGEIGRHMSGMRHSDTP
mgnify:CR=1 FL=1